MQFVPDLVLYHGNCPDGWCAAYLAKLKFPGAELLPSVHGTPPPLKEVTGKSVLVVDFSWKRDVMLALHAAAAEMVVLDHHKPAEAELAGLDFCTFDTQKSGAMLAFDYLFASTLVPWWVKYVQDRDLWQWKLRHSREVNAYIMSIPHTVADWDQMTLVAWDRAADLGRAILGAVNKRVENVVAQQQAGQLKGHKTAVVNCDYTNISDIANVLCERGAAIGLGWFERGDGRMQFSLRSLDDGPDVSVIAKTFGGGGHAHAAGFEMSLEDGRWLVDVVLVRHAVQA